MKSFFPKHNLRTWHRFCDWRLTRFGKDLFISIDIRYIYVYENTWIYIYGCICPYTYRYNIHYMYILYIYNSTCLQQETLQSYQWCPYIQVPCHRVACIFKRNVYIWQGSADPNGFQREAILYLYTLHSVHIWIFIIDIVYTSHILYIYI